jgi:hypothetical protein
VTGLETGDGLGGGAVGDGLGLGGEVSATLGAGVASTATTVGLGVTTAGLQPTDAATSAAAHEAKRFDRPGTWLPADTHHPP